MLAPHLYVDSADANAVGALLAGGLVEGVTTNPTILQRSGRRLGDIPGLYSRWVEQGAGEVFFQTWGTDAAELLANAAPLIALGDRIVVKVPATRAGFVATRELTERGVPVLVTAVYSAAQALAAAAYGARYVAPYFGRLGDAGHDAVAVIGSMHRMLTGSATEVLAASLRSPADIVALRELGVARFTAAPVVIESLLLDDVSESSAAEFEAAIRDIA